MITKIVSGAENDIEKAALDLALRLGIPCSGHMPNGKPSRVTGLTEKYGLVKTAGLGFKQAMEENVAASDGTLLFSKGKKDDRIRYAGDIALRMEKQLLHVDLTQYAMFESASLISSWASMQKIRTVFVTGPTMEEDRTLYDAVQKILETAFYLEFVKTGYPAEQSIQHMDISSEKKEAFPRSVEQAVGILKKRLPLKDRILMANMQPDELFSLRDGLGEYIKQQFGLYAGNSPLIDACARAGGLDKPMADEACAVILRALWKELKATHKLRVIK